MHIYNWYHSITTSILLCTRDEDGYVHEHLLSFSPLAPLAPLLGPLQLTWNPPCCDRIRPPRSQVARKLLPYFPPLAHIPPLPKIPTTQGFPDLNIHSLGRHCEPNPQSSLTILPLCLSHLIISWDIFQQFFVYNIIIINWKAMIFMWLEFTSPPHTQPYLCVKKSTLWHPYPLPSPDSTKKNLDWAHIYIHSSGLFWLVLVNNN
jgi:hypothetical protein